MSSLKTVKNTNNRLELSRSRLSSLFNVVFISAFTFFWYYILLKDFLAENSLIDAALLRIEKDKFIIVFFIVGLLLFYKIFQSIINFIYGEKFEFIRGRGEAIRNKKHFFNFIDVANIQIREICDSDNNKTYRLSVVTKNNGKKFIESSNSKSSIYEIADNLADILKVKIVSKN